MIQTQPMENMKTNAIKKIIRVGYLLALAAVQNSAMRAVELGANGDLPFPVIEKFENYGKEDGIPAYKVHSVLKTIDNKLWIGTWDGLCERQADGKFKRFGPEQGLSHKLVVSMVEDPKTGDLWIGTMRGLNKYSGGKITRYLQTDSGLPNNVVYGVDVFQDQVWVATAAGAGSLDLKTGVWKIFDHNNAAMHEPCVLLDQGRQRHCLYGGMGWRDSRTRSGKRHF